MAKKSRKPVAPTRAETAPRPQPSPAAALQPAAEAPQSARHYFAPEDWIAAVITFLISGAAFLYYMSPEVTLEDSGELVTGSFNFGVPHPPGYPLWTFLAWIWRHLVPFGNPAWRTCLMSVLTGALVVGVLTLLLTRSILMLLRNCSWCDELEEPMKHWIALTVGATAALLFGFNRGVWLWACVPEMRVLNVFMFVLTACTFFAWMMRPQRHALLYATILVYGLGISNHQTIVVMAMPFMIGVFAAGWLSADEQDRELVKRVSAFWELAVAGLFALSCGAAVDAWLQTPSNGQVLAQNVKVLILFGPLAPASLMIIGPLVVGLAMLFVFGANGWLDRKRALISTAAFFLGCSFYLYMPISSSTNPPMNWGYTATKQGFLHHITRGQYEQLNLSWPWTPAFWIQVRLFTTALLQQYTLPLCLIGLATAALLVWGWKHLRARGRSWLIFVWAAFLVASLGLLTIINPGLDKQNQEINIKFFAPAHGFYAMLIAYGIAIATATALTRWKQLPRGLVRVGCVALLALPLIPFQRNWALCVQRGNDFGYQFGYRMFYPGGGYPPMEKDAVLYGGTDPGRFVPTYMIFCESRVKPEDRFQDSHFDPEGGKNFDRRDVYIITQNALADNTYMSYIRDHYDYSRPDYNNPETLKHFEPWQRWLYKFAWLHMSRNTMYPKEPIYIPSENDLQRAFQEYVRTVQARQAAGQQLGPDENVELDPQGRVSVRGVGGVMAINGILTQWIFERNRDKHAFYVEESYVIPWMYQYLTPCGIIMKINHDPLPSPESNPEVWSVIVQRDREYWDKLCADFMARPEFQRSSDAQKTFSKLRSAIGGLYANRRMIEQAEYAFKQALALCPESPEANFRLAQLYVEMGRFDDAVNVLTALQRLDPLNNKIGGAIQQIQVMRQERSNIQQFEQARRNTPRDFNLVRQLAQSYFKLGQTDHIFSLCDSYLAQTELTSAEMMPVAQLYVSINQIDRAIAVLKLITQRYPDDSQAYYAIAMIRSAQGIPGEALDALEKAIQITPALRDQARSDQRLANLRTQSRFQQLVGAAPPAPKGMFP